ncbi:unnamed protein product [Chilo suppressalis]|uniref:FLYWCH-type domain-containing protein n=1 Tax=Chilo suppressalis TaxID=168631 RepID=A0ABN8AT62_CHISP|nr:unnamed protein product [Chilo suppressalis]
MFVISLTDRPTFFTSKIGARIMQVRGYHYTRRSVCSSKVRWLCTESRDRNCHAVVVTIGEGIPQQSEPEGILIPTKSGKKNLLMINGYTYWQNHYSTNWLCSSKRRGCEARLRNCITTDECVMIPSRFGKKNLLMLDGYTFSQVNYSPRWVCSSTRTYQCPARLRYEIDAQKRDVQFIPTEKGKYILVLKGFTYSQVGGRFFYCSSKHTGCRARVRLMSGQLVPSGDAHNHAPPSHARCGNGAFVQLRPRSQVLSPAPTILPSPLTSPSAAALALHALGFPRLLPKADMWLRTPNPEEKKDV